MTTYRYGIIWLCAALFYGYQYILRVIPSVLKTEIMETFQFNTITFGQFAGIYYLGYTIAHIPFGIALDRFGPKYTLPFSILLSMIGMMPLYMEASYAWGIFGRFILGIGSSCAFIGLVKVVQLFFEQRQFQRLLSFGSIFGLIGAIFGGYPIIYFLGYTSWQNIIFILILVGFMMSIILFLILPQLEYQQKTENIMVSLKKVITNKTVLLIACGGGFMVGPMEGYADAWATESLIAIHGLSKHIASQGVSIIYFGFACGLAGLSFIADKMGQKKTILLSGFMMTCSFLFIILGTSHTIFILSLLFVLGFFCAYQVPAIYMATQYVQQENVGLSSSFTNTIFMLFGLFFHTLIAGSMEWFAFDLATSYQHINYSCDVYQKGLFMIPLCLLLGLFIFTKIKKPTIHKR